MIGAVDAGVLALQSRDAQPSLVTYLDAYAREALVRLPADDSLAARGRETVALELRADAPEIDKVAARLAMSERTLQWRLAEEGATFAAPVTQVRRAYAERYLADDHLALAERRRRSFPHNQGVFGAVPASLGSP